MQAPLLIALVLAAVVTCAAPDPPGHAPTGLLGDWIDDYGIRYEISDTLWLQQPSSVYRVRHWELDGQFLVAQNGPENPADGGLYTRIDWVPIPELAPWEWAFCMATWDANSAEGAAVAPSPDREHLRSGCGGHPFSRLRRVPADSVNLPGRGDP